MSLPSQNMRHGPAIDGGEALRDYLPECDRIWARLLKEQKYENVRLKPSYDYKPVLGDGAREIA